MKAKVFVLVALLGALPLFGGERFESSGLSAEFGDSGIIKNLRYDGLPLAERISLVGEYNRAPGERKYDSHFYQDWDYAKTAQFQREEGRLVMTNESTIGNEALKEGVRYKIRCEIEADRLTYSCEVVLNAPLRTHHHIFDIQIAFPPSLFGRGVKEVSASGVESYKIIPMSCNSKVQMEGSALSLSTEKGVLNVFAGEGTTVRYCDPRAWGGKNFLFLVYPVSAWSQEAVVHPAGTVWKWSFTMKFDAK